ncbi:hypothetical protein KP509_34G045500 [Ceratopteris richardii]|uniref:MSP domain-containing protein n=1 Tax=Ceratopteris richardii TaxID=49495 RepID=A0A8T2QKD7_CERRI|nr:hypothetical protein KP509_34G045500 [Ceratopteris richardii]
MMGKKWKLLWIPFMREQKTPKARDISSECKTPAQKDGKRDSKKSAFSLFSSDSLLFMSPRLSISPRKRLHFFYEPGKQVSSPIKVKNTSRSCIAFKLQTNAPKSCFTRPSSGILTPGESVIISVVRFIEPPEQKRIKIKEKFKIISLKVKQGVQYTPEMFEEQRESVVVEENLEVIYLDPHQKSREREKLTKRLAEAEVAHQARKRNVDNKIQRTVAAGVVLDGRNQQHRQ